MALLEISWNEANTFFAFAMLPLPKSVDDVPSLTDFLLIAMLLVKISFFIGLTKPTTNSWGIFDPRFSLVKVSQSGVNVREKSSFTYEFAPALSLFVAVSSSPPKHPLKSKGTALTMTNNFLNLMFMIISNF